MTIGELVANQRPGYSLDQRFYVEPEIFALELERILLADWLLAGHESELPQAGDYKVIEVAGESAIIVRGADGALRAFANVCRHRGSLVCLEASGSVRRFTCPYHGWMYDLEGRLVAARDMPADFEQGAHGLKSLSVETLGGLLLLSFAASPPAVSRARAEMAEPLGLFGFENLKVAAHRRYPIPANWKLAVENYAECYHCATAHPDYAKLHTLMLDDTKRERLQAGMRERMSACGMRDIYIDATFGKAGEGELAHGYSRTALFEGYRTGSRDGAPVAPLLGELTDYDGGASDFVIGPVSFLLAYSDHVVGYVFTPVDIGNSRCDVYWFVRGDAEAGRDYDVGELTWLWDVTTQADKEIIVNNWRGVRSRSYRPGPFSNMEYWEKCFVEWYLRKLGSGVSQARPARARASRPG
ncbi:MAG: aromatic ring-hydroxylating dioxygenase subunit alpha [Woeseiaceae bacterium]|nr:aromatic ring-hydroxylating dioxygenase subunit alpha [Woeseiaceae bacterium]